MKKNKIFYLFKLCLFLILPSFIEAKEIRNLQSWYQLAQAHNIQTKIEKIQFEILQEQRREVRSQTLPQIAIKGNYSQYGPIHKYEEHGIDDNNGTVYLNAEQALFSGFKEFYGLNSLDLLLKAQEKNIAAQELDLLAQLAQHYFNAQYQQETMQNFAILIKIAKDRENLLEQRVKIGKSKNSDLIGAKVQTAQYLAEENNAKQQLAQELLSLQLLSGEHSNHTSDSIGVPNLVASPENATDLATLQKKVMDHPLVQAKLLQQESLQQEKKANLADYSPVISLKGNYYLQKPASTTINAPNWDVGIYFSWSLIEGGLRNAKINEVNLKQTQNELLTDQLKKELQNQVTMLYQNIQFLEQQKKSYSEIKNLNLKNYESLKKDYSLGLVSNLEVVQALNNYVQSTNNLTFNIMQLELNKHKLKFLTGEML